MTGKGLSQEMIESLMKLHLPPGKARHPTRWSVDRIATLQLMYELEIDYPVKISFQKYKTHSYTGRITYGNHSTDYHKIHYIRMDDTRSYEVANNTLLHEFVHCRQVEQWVKQDPTNRPPNRFYSLAYRHAKGRHGQTYHGNSYEVEAREMADILEKKYQLLVPAP